jgi:succinyl-CoA synthetase beta subunit
LFLKVDALQLEINPLVETDDQQVVSVDAKIGFDDNAQYRQKEIFAMEDATEMDPQEYEASKHNLNYIRMDGNIGCLGKLNNLTGKKCH